jgi:S-DNA-T family DNA segregation ATPase FtsK/SpoIIIE
MMPEYQKKRYVMSHFFMREISILILGTGSLFLLCSLLTYHASDNSWFHYHSGNHAVRNLCGVVGANTAATLIYLFGASSLWVVGIIAFACSLLVRQRVIQYEWERLAAFGLLIVVTTSLSQAYQYDFLGSAVPGGFLGLHTYTFLYKWLDALGTAIFLYTLFAVSLILLGRFSFAHVSSATQAVGSFVMSKDRCWVPLYRGATTAAYYGATPLRVIGTYGYRLLNGSLLGEPAQAAVDQEYRAFEELLYASKTHKMHEAGAQMHTMHTPSAEHSAVTMPPAENTQESLDMQAAALQQESPDAGSRYQRTVYEELDIPLNYEEPVAKEKTYRLPGLNIFIGVQGERDDERLMQDLQKSATILEEKLERFGVAGKVQSIKRGPVVTLFEYQPDIDSKISKIIALEDDLAMALQALSIRIIAPIPGRSVVGFEVANKERKNVLFADIAHSQAFAQCTDLLPLVLGKDTIGTNVVVDLTRMPHLLIAGSTGSGKSVALNGMLVSLLCKKTPDELRMVLIDPKRLEFATYADIPHLLVPIVTDPRKVTPILKWVVRQMEERYERMASCGVRNIQDYNERMQRHPEYEKIPFIVVVIDELADLMMTSGREVEDLITRIAQMARAAGIHLIVATQRPSVDVITGLIKVNFPSRISFRVTSKIDSRTILDANGADKLLGRGDMLFLGSNDAMLRRIHGAYVSDKEIEDLVAYVRSERPVRYLDLNEIIAQSDEATLTDADDELLGQVVAFLDEIDEVSISLIQRRFRIGYNRSARIIDLLESRGMISAPDGGRTRKVIRAN